ncbi:hypothetical protein [Muricomes intestini]
MKSAHVAVGPMSAFRAINLILIFAGTREALKGVQKNQIERI